MACVTEWTSSRGIRRAFISINAIIGPLSPGTSGGSGFWTCFVTREASAWPRSKWAKASEVHAVDVSEAALSLAKANAELNQVSAAIRFVKSDAFEELERLAAAGELFDTVILDPPKLTRHRAGLAKALRGYHSLNQLALGVLNPGGTLVSCSCSGLIGRDDFVSMLGSVSQRSGRPIQILESRGQAADHPTSVHCLETAYLKCYICRVA